MAELKTKQNDASVMDFLNSVENDKRRADGLEMNRIMTEVTGEEPKMWGPSIVGYGNCTLKYETGRELEWMQVGFSPRKQALTLYVLSGSKKQEELLAKLGKFKTGKGCLYINKLEDVNTNVLRELITTSLTETRSC